MDDEKIFNYQLTIQKLEEQLSLYRNGTTSDELFDLLKEKDSEIEKIKALLNEKNENLKKLAKSSNAVIVKYEALQGENATLSEHLHKARNELQNCASVIQTLLQEKESQSAIIAENKQTILLKNNEVTQLTADLMEQSDFVSKLQDRCAVLVTEKNEKQKQFEKERGEQEKQIEDLKALLSDALGQVKSLKEKEEELQNKNSHLYLELTAAHKVISEAKQAILEAHKANEKAAKDFLESHKAQKTTIVGLESKLRAAQDEKASMLQDLTAIKTKINEQTEEYKKNSKFQDETIANLTQQLSMKNVSLEELREMTKCEMARAEEHWKNEISRVKRLHEADLLRIQKLEEEKEKLQINRREMETLKIKNAELDDKVRRQDQYMKARLLKDRTNSLTMPEGSSKPIVGRPPL